MPKSQAVAQKGHFDRLTAVRKRCRIGWIYIFSLFFQEKTFAIGFLAPILRLTRRCRTYARAYEKATRNQIATSLAKSACRLGHHFGRLRHFWAICDGAISFAPRIAVLILIFVVWIGVVGFYESAHAVDRTARWLIYSAESSSSDLSRLLWSGIDIFDEAETTESFFAVIDGRDSFLIQTSERGNISRTHGNAHPDFLVFDIRSLWWGHTGRQLSVSVDDVEIHTDTGNGGLGVPYIRIDNLYGNRLVRTESDKPYMLDSDLGPVSRKKFGAGEPKLKVIHSPEARSRESEDASKSHEPQIVTSDGLFGGLMPLFYGLGIGCLLVFGGGILARRLWGV
jgi:hypothetical protein